MRKIPQKSWHKKSLAFSLLLNKILFDSLVAWTLNHDTESISYGICLWLLPSYHLTMLSSFHFLVSINRIEKFLIKFYVEKAAFFCLLMQTAVFILLNLRMIRSASYSLEFRSTMICFIWIYIIRRLMILVQFSS